AVLTSTVAGPACHCSGMASVTGLVLTQCGTCSLIHTHTVPSLLVMPTGGACVGAVVCAASVGTAVPTTAAPTAAARTRRRIRKHSSGQAYGDGRSGLRATAGSRSG